MGNDSQFLGQLLNDIEDRELPLLSWGLTSGALSEDEVLETIEQALDTYPTAPGNASPRTVLNVLVQRSLLFREPGSSPRRYRSRFAETLRLTANLRQLFPAWRFPGGDPPENWWHNGKRLIADYRLHTTARKYPKRDIPAEEALKAFSEVPGWGPLSARVAAQQVGSRELSRFQVDATRSIFGSLVRGRNHGVIVGAGTGSGKTLAFYLPAFAAMAEAARSGKPGVHTLALYPRIELLRDQLRDALSTAQETEDVLSSELRRPLRIGALYGHTPNNTESLRNGSQKGWRPVPQRGLICPYLMCPQCGTGDLLWSDRDRDRGLERLTCLQCTAELPHGRLALTRQSMRDTPPDLLFTTTEMLNRHSANPYLGGLLGWTGRHRPSLVLLDEVHTYSGPQGAQVALLLRRWRHAVSKPITFVGLSATLKDAERFFAQLTGLPTANIDCIEPTTDCMEEESREYALALRGDPVSGTSLLSASIQTAMLFGRFLDPQENGPGPESLFGNTGFLFTDDLDVTNRFYDDLRDAEGGQSRFGRTGRKAVLASLRSPDLPQNLDRYQDGQSWNLMDKIGHHLDSGLRSRALRIGRTSSQDAGVDLNAQLTVATASLEVGFNDPRVGLVLQHKAPYDAAAFIQRRGRAGRRRGTRPVTVITLSDYGRDRLAYQGYEALFAPEIPARSLPVGNRYVLKIQAAQVFLDWLGWLLRENGNRTVDPRKLLTPPYGDRDSRNQTHAREQVAAWIRELLEGNERLRDSLARYVGKALQVSADEVKALLWEQPRSLLLGVAPTALRRLESDWNPLRDDPGAVRNAVLPEFVPRALFEPLNIPEVQFDLPFGDSAEPETMPVAKALREAVPGRVSRRYGYQRDEHRTWLPVPEHDGGRLELKNLVPDAASQGQWCPPNSGPESVEVFRPFRIKLSAPPEEIADRSQGRPLWGTEITSPSETPLSEADLPDPSPWRDRIRSLGFATHAAGNSIEVRRMTYGAECEISRQRQEGADRLTVHYTYDGVPAALGFSLDVDAMHVQIAPLDLANPSVQDYLTSPEWRSKAFFRAVAEDTELTGIANTFQRDWLALIYITAFSLAGLDGTRTPEEIRVSLAGGFWRDRLTEILEVLYREDGRSNAHASPVTSRLSETLTALSHEPAVITVLDRAGLLLVTNDITQRTADLARRTYRDTLASAILNATLRACPDAQDTDVIIDVVPGQTPDSPDTIWMSETSIGGLGIIESLVRFYAEDPRRFWSLVTTALQPNEYEYVDATLTRLLQHVVQEDPSGPAANSLVRLRRARSSTDSEQALEQLRTAWTELDGPPRHSAISSLSTRLLRPGSSAEIDTAALRLITAWEELQQRLGFEVDARVIAYAVGSGQLNLGGSRSLSADQAFSMLWPRGERARNHHLQHYQPFLDADRPMVLDRLLLESAHDECLPHIEVTKPDWTQTYQKSIAESGAVNLVCPTSDRQVLSDVVARVPALHVDRDVMRVYGEISGITRYGNEFRVRVELRETEQ
ncbi:DEAD/DEAH box helicase [Nocardiopsis dassonvillei]|uniref:protein DpdJ n=1 Tax=Nocardiopsis dassonvillei TaxID=2014 RepID=UPI00200CBF09|nr:protein DpdJ [Nocardiopsis dassonvillei]MCK9871172.1 DEAD/DEAH box helicase [Nocardiopsis dassonvillei]